MIFLSLVSCHFCFLLVLPGNACDFVVCFFLLYAFAFFYICFLPCLTTVKFVRCFSIDVSIGVSEINSLI